MVMNLRGLLSLGHGIMLEIQSIMGQWACYHWLWAKPLVQLGSRFTLLAHVKQGHSAIILAVLFVLFIKGGHKIHKIKWLANINEFTVSLLHVLTQQEG